MPKKKQNWFSEFMVLGVFAGVVFVGFIFGAVSLLAPSSSHTASPDEVVETAPTVEEYQGEVGGILIPFVDQVESLDPMLLDDAGQEFVILIKKTHARMLGVIVPASMRDAHMAFVLLLEQWKRAAEGSDGDRKVVQGHTTDVLDEHAWIRNYKSAL